MSAWTDGSPASSAKARNDDDEGCRPPGLSDWLRAGKPIPRTQDSP